MDSANLWTILGCGTSSGVPLIGCSCSVCRSKDPKDQRSRAAVWVQSRGRSLLIDTATDLRMQALRAKLSRVDGVLYTHPHADHIHGIDELRSFNYTQKSTIPVFGNAWTVQELENKFAYIFKPNGPSEGGGIPQLTLHEIKPEALKLDVAGVPVEALILKHGSKDCLGYRIDSVAYVTDCSYIPQETLERLRGLDALILDCVRVAKHPTHFNLEQALDLVEQVHPKKTYLTHLGHDFRFRDYSKPGRLPKGVSLAFDGLKIKGKVSAS